MILVGPLKFTFFSVKSQMDHSCKLRCVGKVSSRECSQDQSKLSQKANNLEKNKEAGKNSSQDQSKVLLKANRLVLSKEAGKNNRPALSKEAGKKNSLCKNSSLPWNSRAHNNSNNNYNYNYKSPEKV